jgi:hypothetical protein
MGLTAQAGCYCGCGYATQFLTLEQQKSPLFLLLALPFASLQTDADGFHMALQVTHARTHIYVGRFLLASFIHITPSSELCLYPRPL